MLNYIYAELWRTLRRPASKVLLILVCVLPLTLNLLAIDAEDYLKFSDTVAMAYILMPFAGLVCVLMLVDLNFGDEFRLGTLKNAVSAGISRTTVYFGKMCSTFLLCLLYLGAALIIFFVSGLLILPAGETLSFQLTEFFSRLGGALGIWIAAITALEALYFTFRHGMAAVIVFSCILAVPFFWMGEQTRMFLLGFNPFYLLGQLSFGLLPDQQELFSLLERCWLTGAGWLVLFVLGGWLLFRRRELP